MLPEAIFFDLDDTILRYNMTPESAWQEACNVAAEKTKLFDANELFSLINTTRDWYWSDPERHRAGRLNLNSARTDIVIMAMEKLGCVNEKTAAKIATDYSNFREASLGLFPNSENILRELLKKEIKMALLTNGAGKVQQGKINKFGLTRYFPACFIEGELGYGKPDQRVFETALNKLLVTPDQTWMVGDDMERDIAGAQKVGIFTIWHDYDNKGLPKDSKIIPDRIINSITELLTI